MKKLTANLFVSMLLLGTNCYATNYYFSSSGGDDSRSSTQAQNSSTPWKTLGKLNSIFSTLKGGDFVYFKRGDVFYGSINVTKAGSSSTALINFGAYGTGNKPIITGLSDVSGWTSVGTNLWQSSVIANGQSTALTLLINGTYYPMGRYPNANTTNGGYLTYESSGTNYITDNQLTTSTNWTGAQVVVRKATWILDKGTITSHSGGTLTYTPTASGSNSGVSGAGYFIQNDVRTLDQQGEWYYNPSTKKLTVYWSGTPPTAQISSVTTVLDGGAKSYTKFDNLVFKGSIGRMINIPTTSNFTFTYCDFLDAGEDAIWCSSASNLDIENCTINYTNNNALVGSGLSGFTIKSTTINNTGIYPGMTNQRSSYSCEGIHVSGNNITIQNNSVTNTGFTVINFQGNNVTIRNNYLDSYCSVKGDGAAIYTWVGSSGTVYTNRIIDGNICLNAIEAVNGSANPSNDILLDAALYIDDYSQNISVTNNSIANCPKGIYLHNVSNITVRGNTVYNNTYGGIIPRYTGGNLLRNITCIGNKVVEKSSTVACYRYKSTSLDILSTGTSDSNYYARPMADNTTMQTEAPGSVWYTLAQFQTTFSSREKNSKKSPKTITNVNDLRFEYNPTSSNKVVNLGATYIDVKGTTYAGTITLAPYTSAVLIYQSGVIANQAPVANAGNPLSINLPVNLVQLNGSASSDAGGTIAAYSWSKISGPSSAIILTPSLVTTTVNTLVQGVYQFELKVTDNQGAVGKDTVQVTVNAVANAAPVANAGPDRDITIPAFKKNSPIVLSLTGTGTDNDGTIASYKWSKISGPVCTIDNPNQSQTMIRDLTYGVYVFELAVTDNQGAIGKDRMQITLDTAVSPSKNQAEIVDENEMIARSSFIIYPNPVRDNFTLSINNNHTGKMNIQIVNQAGMIVRRFILNKDQQTNNVNLPAGDLPVGVYFIHVQIGNWSDKRKILKL